MFHAKFARNKEAKEQQPSHFGWFLAQKNVAHLLLWFPKQLGTLGQCNMM
jgi:hypothetical protein